MKFNKRREVNFMLINSESFLIESKNRVFTFIKLLNKCLTEDEIQIRTI